MSYHRGRLSMLYILLRSLCFSSSCMHFDPFFLRRGYLRFNPSIIFVLSLVPFRISARWEISFLSSLTLSSTLLFQKVCLCWCSFDWKIFSPRRSLATCAAAKSSVLVLVISSAQNDAKHLLISMVSPLRRLLFTCLIGFVWIRSGSSTNLVICSVISCIRAGSCEALSLRISSGVVKLGLSSLFLIYRIAWETVTWGSEFSSDLGISVGAGTVTMLMEPLISSKSISDNRLFCWIDLAWSASCCSVLGNKFASFHKLWRRLRYDILI